MTFLAESSPIHVETATAFFSNQVVAMWKRPKSWLAIVLLSISTALIGAPTAPLPFFDGVLHAKNPHGIYTEIQFGPHRLIAKVHAPQMCVLHAHLVHGDPRASRYMIEPPKGGRFCDELVDGEIVIHPHSTMEVMAEFRSPRMKWSGEFHRYAHGR
jgi:hypothetical protein